MSLFKKSPLKSSRLVKKKRKAFAFKIFLCVLFFASLAYGAVWFLRKPEFQINSIDVSGNVSVSSVDVQFLVNEKISGSYFFLFPKSNSFIYPKEAIIKELVGKFPGIASIGMSLENQKLKISIVERVPAYLWCKGEPKKDEGSCYFMDKDGYIFAESPKFSGPTYFSFYGIISSENPIGLDYADKIRFESFNNIRNTLEKNNITTFAGNLQDNGISELYLVGGGKLIFKISQDPELIVSALILIRDETGIMDRSSKELEYIDMRFGNKVYYKFVGDNAVQSGQ